MCVFCPIPLQSVPRNRHARTAAPIQERLLQPIHRVQGAAQSDGPDQRPVHPMGNPTQGVRPRLRPSTNTTRRWCETSTNASKKTTITPANAADGIISFESSPSSRPASRPTTLSTKKPKVHAAFLPWLYEKSSTKRPKVHAVFLPWLYKKSSTKWSKVHAAFLPWLYEKSSTKWSKVHAAFLPWLYEIFIVTRFEEIFSWKQKTNGRRRKTSVDFYDFNLDVSGGGGEATRRVLAMLKCSSLEIPSMELSLGPGSSPFVRSFLFMPKKSKKLPKKRERKSFFLFSLFFFFCTAPGEGGGRRSGGLMFFFTHRALSSLALLLFKIWFYFAHMRPADRRQTSPSSVMLTVYVTLPSSESVNGAWCFFKKSSPLQKITSWMLPTNLYPLIIISLSFLSSVDRAFFYAQRCLFYGQRCLFLWTELCSMDRALFCGQSFVLWTGLCSVDRALFCGQGFVLWT